jgi:hypothetical protein
MTCGISMTIIQKILSRDEFIQRPPVLIDIGASGDIHQKWSDIAAYSICIAFDADDREMGYVIKESSGYRKLYVYSRVVTDFPALETDFFLTTSPYCSSLLKPREDKLRQWEFENLFKVQKTVRLKAVTLPQVLKELGIKYVDWFKTDSQGTDLRLFKSLGYDIVDRIIIAELEPGIIDAYEGEDKLWQVMQYMERHPFWMSGIRVKGSLRLRNDIITDKKIQKQFSPNLTYIKTSPGWGEVTFINNFNDDGGLFGIREFLMGWVVAIIEHQFGFALELAVEGKRRFKDAIFDEMEAHVLKQLKDNLTCWLLNFMRRAANKAVSILDGM